MFLQAVFAKIQKLIFVSNLVKTKKRDHISEGAQHETTGFVCTYAIG
jgi:hypothetical protein